MSISATHLGGLEPAFGPSGQTAYSTPNPSFFLLPLVLGMENESGPWSPPLAKTFFATVPKFFRMNPRPSLVIRTEPAFSMRAPDWKPPGRGVMPHPEHPPPPAQPMAKRPNAANAAFLEKRGMKGNLQMNGSEEATLSYAFRPYSGKRVTVAVNPAEPISHRGTRDSRQQAQRSRSIADPSSSRQPLLPCVSVVFFCS